jgi:hypothetical protein
MGIVSTQAFTFRLIANGQQLDVFNDEDITLSNNVTGLFDIGVLPSDFSRQITLPGTKVNNAFFEHVYDISIDNPFLFATNIKVPAYFDFDSIYLSQGYLQLNKVNLLANKFIDSYEVTIYGTLSSFGRDVNRAYLTDLTSLSKYNHTSSFENISASWNGDLFDGDIVYPFADYGSAWSFTPGDRFFGLDDNEGAITVQDYKPAIRIKKVWDAIFEYAGFTYTSSFWDQSFLQDAYMICNYALKYPEYADVDLENFGKTKVSAISGSGMTDWQPTYNTATLFPWYNIELDPTNIVGQDGAYTLQKGSVLSGTLSLNVNFSSSLNVSPVLELHYWPTSSTPEGAGSGLTTLVNFNAYFDEYRQANTGGGGINETQDITTKFTTSYLDAGAYYFGLKYYTNFSPTGGLTLTFDKGGKPKSFISIDKVKNAADGRIMDIPSNMPFGTNGIKMIDFITSIQKKFNLIMYPDKTKQNQFVVETFNDWYRRGEIKDFNQYINLDEKIEVIPANNLAVNELTFSDTLDNDYISQQFNKESNREYGKTYYVDTTNFFSQGKFEVKTQLASDPLIYLSGTGLSGSVGGLAPTFNCYNYSYFAYAGCTIYWINCGGFLQSAYVAAGQSYFVSCAREGTLSGCGPFTQLSSC